MPRKLLIVGNGAAGFSALQAIRELDREASVSIVSAEGGPAYLRVLLATWLSGRLADEALVWARREDYSRLGASLLEHNLAVGLEADSRRLFLQDAAGRDTVLPYDALLVATGASPVVPAGVRLDLPGVWVLRTREQAVRLGQALGRQASPNGGTRARALAEPNLAPVVVVGAGPLGLKVAISLLESGFRPLVIEMYPHLLPGKADWEAAALVRSHLEKLGMQFYVDTTVTGVREAGGRLAGIEISAGRPARGADVSRAGATGRFLECSQVIFCTGVRPECGWLAGRLATQLQALTVDAAMRTSVEGVFAAGDAACAFDVAAGSPRLNAIWPQAVATGRIAGFNMALGDRQPGCPQRPFLFSGGLGRNALDIAGLAFCSLGIVQQGSGDPLEAEVRRGEGWYRKVTFRDGRLTGAVLVGRVEEAGRLQAALRREALQANGTPRPELCPAGGGGAI